MNISNALPILQREIKAGNVPNDVAALATALITDVQKDVVEISGRCSSGTYSCNPCWSGSSASRSLKFDPQNPPTADEPLKGRPAYSDSYSQWGKWGFTQEKTLSCSDQGIVFEQLNDGRSRLKISMNSDGTCKVEVDANPDQNSWCPG